MRTLRPHKKSRKGCLNCKSKKVKCDEAQPSCSMCYRRGMQCTYPRATCRFINHGCNSAEGDFGKNWDTVEFFSLRARPAELLSYHARLPAAAPDITSAMLLSEYLQRTCSSLVGNHQVESRSRIYKEEIPSLAISHPSVSHAIYAISTLSLAAHSDDWRLSMTGSHLNKQMSDTNWSDPVTRRACDHYGRSLQMMSGNLSSLTDGDNAEAVIACAILLTPYELAQSRIKRDAKLAQNTASLFYADEEKVVDLAWMTYIRGLASLMTSIQTRGDWNRSTMFPYFSWILNTGFTKRSSPTNSFDSAMTTHESLYDSIIDEAEAAISNIHEFLSKSCDSVTTSGKQQLSRVICLAAIEILEEVFERLAALVQNRTSQDLFRILMLWVGKVDEAYFVLLSKDDTLALAVYAHFLVFLILLEDVWYIGDLGAASVKSILATIEHRRNYHGCVKDRDSSHGRLFSWPASILHRYNAIR